VLYVHSIHNSYSSKHKITTHSTNNSQDKFNTMYSTRRARRKNKITIPYSIVALLHSLQLYFLLIFLYSKYLLVFVFLPAQKTDQLAQTLMIPRTSVVIGFYAFLTKTRSQSFFHGKIEFSPNHLYVHAFQ